MKYNYFDKQQSESFRDQHPFIADHLHYNKDKDCYYCPIGQQMTNIGTAKKITAAGFEQTITRYKAANCEGCHLRVACHKSKSERIIEVNHNLNRHKQRVQQKLNTEQGIYYRKRRPADVNRSLEISNITTGSAASCSEVSIKSILRPDYWLLRTT